MAQTKAATKQQTKAPATNVQANTQAPINNGLTALVQQAINNVTATAPTGARQVGMVQFINGWPNGVPVQGMQPLQINGALHNGGIAHTNPVAKAYAAGKPQAIAVPAFKQQGQLVQWGKKQAPLVSPNPTNQLFAIAVHAALAANPKQTLGQLAQACANAGGAACMPNVVPWLVQHAYGRTHWLVNA